MEHDTHRCPICAAEFASSDDLVRHEKASHTQKGSSSKPSDDSDSGSPRERQGREFDRRNYE